MEKKEFPKKWSEPKIGPEPLGGELGSFPSRREISNKLFDITKLILGIALLPFVYACSVAFLSQISNTGISIQNYFWIGIITLLLLYLFAWEPTIVYEKGHKLLEIIFSFFQPFVKVAPYLLPIYVVVSFILYLLLSIFIQDKWLLEYAMFLFGFAISLHLVYAAKTIRSKKGGILKSNYIFGFSFMYIVNLILISACLNFIIKEFSFVGFCNETYSIASSIFRAVFSQLFSVRS